ncbi:hypothetical protein R6Q59_028464 [Mikania micrantha]
MGLMFETCLHWFPTFYHNLLKATCPTQVMVYLIPLVSRVLAACCPKPTKNTPRHSGVASAALSVYRMLDCSLASKAPVFRCLEASSSKILAKNYTNPKPLKPKQG